MISAQSLSYLCHSAIAAPMSNTFNFIRLDARVFEWGIVNKQNPWYQHKKVEATFKITRLRLIKQIYILSTITYWNQRPVGFEVHLISDYHKITNQKYTTNGNRLPEWPKWLKIIHDTRFMAIFAIPLKQKALIPAHGSELHKVRRGYIDKCIYFISLDCRNTEESI